NALTLTHGTETLVIEVIRHAVHAHLFQGLVHGRDLVVPQGTQGDPKTVGPDVPRCVGRLRLAEVPHAHIMVLQVALRSAENGKVLHGLSVAVFETAIGNTPRLDFPAPADGL